MLHIDADLTVTRNIGMGPQTFPIPVPQVDLASTRDPAATGSGESVARGPGSARAIRSSPARSHGRVTAPSYRSTKGSAATRSPASSPCSARSTPRRGPNRTTTRGRPPTTAERTPGGIAAGDGAPADGVAAAASTIAGAGAPAEPDARRPLSALLGRGGPVPRRWAPHRVPRRWAPPSPPDDPRAGAPRPVLRRVLQSSPARRARRRPTANPRRRPQLSGRCRRWGRRRRGRGTGFGGPLGFPVRSQKSPHPAQRQRDEVGQFLGGAVPVQRRQDRALARLERGQFLLGRRA